MKKDHRDQQHGSNEKILKRHMKNLKFKKLIS